jgi:hypothetical protein
MEEARDPRLFFGRDRLEYKIQRIDRAVRTSDERLKRQ